MNKEQYYFNLPLNGRVEVTQKQFVDVGRWKTDGQGTYFNFTYRQEFARYSSPEQWTNHILDFQNPYQVKEVLNFLKTGEPWNN